MDDWTLLTGSMILSSETIANSRNTETYGTYVRSGYAVVSKATIGDKRDLQSPDTKYMIVMDYNQQEAKQL